MSLQENVLSDYKLDNERIMQKMIDGMAGFISYIDMNSTYLKVNQTYLDFFGLESHQILGKKVSEIVRPDTWASIEPYLVRALHGKLVKYENPVVSNQGQKIHLEVSYIPDISPVTGFQQGVVMISLDITERKNQELWLKEILDELPIGLLMTEPGSGKGNFSNKLAKNLYEKYSLADFYDLEGERLAVQDLPHQRAARAEVFRNEIVKLKTPLRETILSFNSAVIPPMHGHKETVIIPFTDVTAMMDSQRKLEAALKGRDDFLSIASHELKTPLTSIQLQTQMSKRRLKKNSDEPICHTELEKIVNQTEMGLKRLNRLVDDMLDVSRINSGKLSFNYEHFDILDLVLEVTERMSPLAKLSDTYIGLTNLESVHGEWDRFRLEQVLTNLITNALRYGESSPVTISMNKERGSFILSVADKGPGISEEYREKIFERFERESPRESVSGLGLGLYISREIIQRHDGSIWVESAPGDGATFKIKLPVY